MADLFNQLDLRCQRRDPGRGGRAGIRAGGIHPAAVVYVFDDLLMLDKNGIKEVLGRVDRKLLTMALKGTSEELQDHILQTMSQRGAAMLMEDMEAMGPVKIKEVAGGPAADHRRGPPVGTEGVVSTGGGAEQYVE